MHDHDADLVAALAEGSLAAEAARSAASEIDACRECSTDLSAQRTALDAVAAAPIPALSTLEAAQLRSAVASELSIPVVPAVSGRRRRTPWGAIAVAAASLAGIVAIVPVLGLLSTTDGGDAADTIPVALEESAAETTAGNDLRAATGEVDDAAVTPDIAEPASPAEAAESEFGPESTGAFAAEAPQAGQANDGAASPSDEPTTTEAAATTVPAGDREGLPPLVSAAELTAYLAVGVQDGDLIADEALAETVPCRVAAMEQLGAGALPLAPTVLLEDGREAVAFVDVNRADWAVFDLADCSVVAGL
jgi:hypothetical protein